MMKTTEVDNITVINLTVAKQLTVKYEKKCSLHFGWNKEKLCWRVRGGGWGRTAMRKGETPGDGSKFRGVHRQSKHKLQLSNVIKA